MVSSFLRVLQSNPLSPSHKLVEESKKVDSEDRRAERTFVKLEVDGNVKTSRVVKLHLSKWKHYTLKMFKIVEQEERK